MRPRRKKSVDRVIPQWESDAHNLFWQRQLVKHFKSLPAKQEAILDQFQKAGWLDCLEISSLGDAANWSKKQLHAAIENLNRSVNGVLHFRQEASGGRICWEPAK